MPADLLRLALERKLSNTTDPDKVKALNKRIKDREANPPPEVVAPSELNDLNKADLLDLAAQQEIEGRSSMTKDELIEALGGTP